MGQEGNSGVPGGLRGPSVVRHRTARQIAGVVSSAFAVRPDAICRPSRGGKDTAFARQVAMYLSHTRLGLSYTAAGALFGRDRTTAAHACRTVEERREDGTVDAIVDRIERAVDRLADRGSGQ